MEAFFIFVSALGTGGVFTLMSAGAPVAPLLPVAVFCLIFCVGVLVLDVATDSRLDSGIEPWDGAEWDDILDDGSKQNIPEPDWDHHEEVTIL